MLALKVRRQSTSCPENRTARSGRTRHPRADRHQVFRRQGRQLRLLRRYIPTNCPSAIAFSFDLWDAFLDQTLRAVRHCGRTSLRVWRLTRTTRRHCLAQDQPGGHPRPVHQDGEFQPGAATGNHQRLAPRFNPQRNIRFRSSTNVEDSEQFTGAGLYDSYSGCLLDDLDGDAEGPSQCDPAEAKERGVFSRDPKSVCELLQRRCLS